MKSSAHFARAFGLGVLSVGGFAPFGLIPLTPLALAGVFFLWRRHPEKAPLAGWSYGFGLFLAGVSWIYVSLHQFGGMAAPLSLLAVALFAAVMALYPLIAGWLFRRFQGTSWLTDALLAAACWTLMEWVRGWMFTGFPWLVAGYSQTPPSPLAGFAPLFGVYGITLALTLAAALIAFAWGERAHLRTSGGFLGLLLLAGALLLPIAWTTPRPTAIEVSLLQGNIEQSLKWRPELLDLSLNTYQKLARENPARILVLPETALPIALERLPLSYLETLRGGKGAGSTLQDAPEHESRARSPSPPRPSPLKGEGSVVSRSATFVERDVIIGAITFDQAGNPYNAAVSFGAAPSQRYAKSHLVAFGEFTPPLFKWTLDLLSIPMSDLSRGTLNQPPLALAGEKIAVNICYEDVFGEEIIRALPEATILLNLSNTAWFGDSFAQPQHLQISRMRALETGRPMLRATNTGMTAAIAPDGTVLGVLPPFTVGALKVTVHGYEGLTPYARWGNWPAILACLGMLGYAVWRKRKA